MSRIRAHRIVHFAGLTATPSLLTWLRSRGRHHGQALRYERGSVTVSQSSRDSIEPSGAPDRTATDARMRYWHWLDVAVTVLWVALLLSVVGYAIVEGETALAQLDGLALVATYSLSP
jgi:hypothetical protein